MMMTDFFSESVDAWGAAEWFDRLAKAIREQDAAVVANDYVTMDICSNVAASSAMRLVRGYEQQVRAALAATPAVGGEANTKLVYIKRWRTIIRVSEQYADEIVDALRAPPASPLRGKISSRDIAKLMDKHRVSPPPPPQFWIEIEQMLLANTSEDPHP